MPRQRGIILPGEIHHVLSRGLDRNPIFRDDRDRLLFLATAGRILTEGKCSCYAWVLMENHFHLVLRPLGDPLPRVMRRLNGSYARHFNQRYERTGYLFHDRYKSLATQEYWYLRELIRYVHLNPLRAGIVGSVDALTEYPWSGHRGLMGGGAEPWHSIDETLSRFGKTRIAARAAYLAWLREGIGRNGEGWKPEAEIPGEQGGSGEADPAIDGRVAGDAEFVRAAISRANAERCLKNEMFRKRPSLEELFAAVCRKQGIAKEYALSRGRRDDRTRMRTSFCKQSVRDFGYAISQVAVFLGVNASAVARMVWKPDSE